MHFAVCLYMLVHVCVCDCVDTQGQNPSDEHRALTNPRAATTATTGGSQNVVPYYHVMIHEEFWDEVFLLKVNAAYLERCLLLTTEHLLLPLKVS